MDPSEDALPAGLTTSTTSFRSPITSQLTISWKETHPDLKATGTLCVTRVPLISSVAEIRGTWAGSSTRTPTSTAFAVPAPSSGGNFLVQIPTAVPGGTE